MVKRYIVTKNPEIEPASDTSHIGEAYLFETLAEAEAKRNELNRAARRELYVIVGPQGNLI